MFQCPCCYANTISLLDKLSEMSSDEPNICEKCRGEWSLSYWKFFWLLIGIVGILSFKISWIVSAIAVALYLFGMILFTPIKKRYH